MPRSVDPEAYPFPTPVPNYLLKVQAIMGFDTTNWRMAHDAVDIYAMSEPYNVTLDGSGLLTVHNCGSEENIRVGDSYVLRHQVYSLNGFSIQNCSDVELQGVQLFSIPGESLAKALVIQLLGTTAPSRLSSTQPAQQAIEKVFVSRLPGLVLNLLWAVWASLVLLLGWDSTWVKSTMHT